MRLLRAAAKQVIPTSQGSFDWEGYAFFKGKTKEQLMLSDVLRTLGYEVYTWTHPAILIRVYPRYGDIDSVLIEGEPVDIWHWLRLTDQIDW